jgi:predicted phosphodiesterase
MTALADRLSAKKRMKTNSLDDIAQKGENTTRIITLSDTHKDTLTIARGAVNLARKTNADAILIAGDFVSGDEFYNIMDDMEINKDVYRQWDSLIHQIYNNTPGDEPMEIFNNYFEVNGMDEKQRAEFLQNMQLHEQIKQAVGQRFTMHCAMVSMQLREILKEKPDSCKIGIELGNHEPTICYSFFPKEWLIPDNVNTKEIPSYGQDGRIISAPGIENQVLKINDHIQVVGHVGSSERYAGLPDELYKHLSSVRQGRHYKDAVLKWRSEMGAGTLEEVRAKAFEEDKTYQRLKGQLKPGTVVVTHKSSSPNGADEEKHPDSIDVDWGAYHAVTEAVKANPKGSIVEMTGHMHSPKVTWKGITPIQRTEGDNLYVTDFDNTTQTRKKIHHVQLRPVYDPKEVKKYFEVTIPKYNLAMRKKYGIERLIQSGSVKRKAWELGLAA